MNDVPLIIVEQLEGGYRDKDGNLLTTEDIDRITAGMNILPGSPDYIVFDIAKDSTSKTTSTESRTD